MQEYDISADVVSEYREGIHGIAVLENGNLTAPACNDCHGNHGAIVPLGADSINETCGTCHTHNLDLFNQTRMNKVLSTRDRHGCATCHTAHNIQHPTEAMLGVSDGTVCVRCHEPDDAGGKEAQQMRAVMDSLNLALDSAAEMMRYAENAGYDVNDLSLIFLQGQTAMYMSRTKVHSFSAEAVLSEAEPAFDRFAQVVEEVKKLKREYRMRRFEYGAPLLLAMLLLGTLALLFFILDRKKRRSRLETS
jgi:predicted CXXCH cytochrome family protein